MTGILYHIPRTISSPIVQCMLELDVVGKELTVVEKTFPELKKKSYLAINPMATSPSFQDGDDVIMWESGAVLDFLLERHDPEFKFHPKPLSKTDSTPQQVAARAKYLQLKQYIIATVYPFISSLYIHTFKPLQEQDLEYVASGKEKWTMLLGPVLSRALGEGPYFLGSECSAVDFLVAKPLNNVSSLGLLSDFPALQALFERISKLPSFAKAYGGAPVTENSPRSLLLVPGK